MTTMNVLIQTQPGFLDSLVKMVMDPAFWVIAFGACLVHAVVKATVDYFRKKKD